MSPTQAEVLDHLDRANCPLLWWQATHGVRRARFATVAALVGAGFVTRHPGYSGREERLCDSYLIPTAKGIGALKRLRAERVHAENMRQVERVGAVVDRIVGGVRW